MMLSGGRSHTFKYRPSWWPIHKIETPRDVCRYAKKLLGRRNTEVAILLFFDRQLDVYTIRTACQYDRESVRLYSSTDKIVDLAIGPVIHIHNHPTWHDAVPSIFDIVAISKLEYDLRDAGFSLLDAVVVSKKNCHSIKGLRFGTETPYELHRNSRI